MSAVAACRAIVRLTRYRENVLFTLVLAAGSVLAWLLVLL